MELPTCIPPVESEAAQKEPAGHVWGDWQAILFQVLSPTMPSTPSPFDDWKLRTALLVPDPKMPSTTSP